MILQDVTWTVVDCETTGKDPSVDKPVEIGAIKYHGEREIARWSTLIDPQQPIPPESSGIHNIIDDDVIGAPDVQEALELLGDFVKGSQMVVAHNVAFDRNFLSVISEPLPNAVGVIEWDWLCSYRLARHLLPGAPNHKLGTLRYFRKLNVGRDLVAHRVLGDVTVTAALTVDLVRLYEETQGPDVDLDELLEYARSYIPVRTWPLGRYFGQPLDNAPGDYVRWILGNHDRAKNDRDLRHALEAVVLRRMRSAA